MAMCSRWNGPCTRGQPESRKRARPDTGRLCEVLPAVRDDQGVDKIMAEATESPSPLRAFLAAKLLESLDADGAQELSAERKEEVRRKCREIVEA
jgi:hypothetical protein